MKMNINKACDLKSISVFPPNLRRSAEPQASQQFRSQQSQQSFSQGPSSQRGGFSQMTQSSVEELLINDQRFCSQERDLSLKKASSCLPPINHKREDSQLVGSRSSSGLTRRWSSSASLGESKLAQVSEELEQRFGMMETSLSRFGMMLDSIQSDIMQANRGTKEVFLETERIQQKLILQDTLLQQLIKEQADVKASLDGGVKSILDEFSKDLNKEKLQRVCLMLTSIPEQLETALQKTQRELCQTFTKEIQLQVLASLKMSEPRVQVPAAPQVKAKENLPEQRCPATKVLTGLKMPEPRVQVPTAPQAKENLPEKGGPAAKWQSNSFSNTPLKTTQPQLPRNPYNTSAKTVKTFLSPKIQVGDWKTVKPVQRSLKKRAAGKPVKSEGTTSTQQFEQCSIVIDSDEDIDGGFSCLLDGNTKGANFEWDAEKETERILKTARRTKRKFGNPIIIN
ncbi:putative recombination initiation defects 3 [Cardamine amara subsp. amara]|uniref:Recombination initiation defects 3 n=1 Tax=Cardamine amara subsp. amara TaxID=228776 RepID=A0ABD1BJA3_CARAN